jgi:hypothetical protein
MNNDWLLTAEVVLAFVFICVLLWQTQKLIGSNDWWPCAIGLLFLPLGLWKLIDIFFFIFKHLQIGVIK